MFAQSCPTLGDLMDCSLQGPSMEFPRQEYWSGLPFPSPGDLPDPVSKLASLAYPAKAGSMLVKVTTESKLIHSHTKVM